MSKVSLVEYHLKAYFHRGVERINTSDIDRNKLGQNHPAKILKKTKRRRNCPR